MKKLTSLLVVLCLTLGSFAALAEYPITITVDLNRSGAEGDKVEETFTEAPTRAVVFFRQILDIMLDLGVENSIIAAVDDDFYSVNDFPNISAIENLWEGSRRTISREQVLSVAPDFLMGWDSCFGEDFYNREFCESNGIAMYTPYCCTDFATIEDVYKDYEVLGQIFDVEETATARIDEMKAIVANVQETLGEEAYANPITIFNYDSESDSAPFTACQGLPGDIFKLAGGISIFADIEKAWATVSWEQVVERNPQVIIVNDYAGEGEETVASLYEKEQLQNVDAIINHRVYAVDLNNLEGSCGSAATVAQIAAYLYPDKF